MATRARHPALDFFDAAQKVIDDKQAALKKAQDKQRREDILARRAARKYDREVAKAFAPDYSRYIEPLLSHLSALPARNGQEFLIGGTMGFVRDWSSQENKRAFELHLAYSEPVRPHHTHIDTHPLDVSEKTNGFGMVRPKINALPVLKLDLHYDFLTGETVIAKTVTGEIRRDAPKPYYKENRIDQETLSSIRDLPAIIGKWVAEVAPERIPELKQAIAADAKRARKQPSPR